MTTYVEHMLSQSDFATVAMPFTLYCAQPKCQTYIRVGEPAKRYDAATYTHVNCPKTPHRTFAPHKYGDAR